MPRSNNPQDLIDALENRYEELTACDNITASEYIDDQFSYVDNMEDLIIEELGIEGFVEALTKALDYDTKEEMYEYIIRVYDISQE